MMDKEIYKKIEDLPFELKREVGDFVEFLIAKKKNKPKTRKAGLAKGLIKMNKGFDEPLEDFDEYMYE